MLNDRIFICLIVAFSMIGLPLKAQLIEGSLFKIYRANSIAGTVTQIRLDLDSTYQIKVMEIHCSLCDHEELTRTINSNGEWIQRGDTIYLDETKKLLIEDDSIIRPLFVIGIDTDTLTEAKKKKFEEVFIKDESNLFHLVYDTYSNGVAKIVKDRYRMRRDEYEIEFNTDGSIKSVKYFHDDRQRKRIR